MACRFLQTTPGRSHRKSGGLANAFVGGWQLGAVSTIQSGLAFTVSGGAGRPNRICNGQTPPGGHSVAEWFDISCFVLPATVADPVHGGVYIPFGNSGANVLTGPGIVNFDLSAFKEVHFLNEPCAMAMMNIAIIRTLMPAHISLFARAVE